MEDVENCRICGESATTQRRAIAKKNRTHFKEMSKASTERRDCKEIEKNGWRNLISSILIDIKL